MLILVNGILIYGLPEGRFTDLWTYLCAAIIAQKYIIIKYRWFINYTTPINYNLTFRNTWINLNLRIMNSFVKNDSAS